MYLVLIIKLPGLSVISSHIKHVKSQNHKTYRNFEANQT